MNLLFAYLRERYDYGKDEEVDRDNLEIDEPAKPTSNETNHVIFRSRQGSTHHAGSKGVLPMRLG